eukprot:467100-Pelagomonas_calceolata.AAC.1
MCSAKMKKKGICGPNDALTHNSNQVCLASKHRILAVCSPITDLKEESFSLEKQLENSLDAAKKVASLRNPGNKVQKARDTCGAKNKCVHQYSEKEHVLHLEFDCKTPVTHRGSILQNSQFNIQSMSTKPEPAHITHNLLRQIQKKIPRQ